MNWRCRPVNVSESVLQIMPAAASIGLVSLSLSKSHESFVIWTTPGLMHGRPWRGIPLPIPLRDRGLLASTRLQRRKAILSPSGIDGGGAEFRD